MDIWIVFLWVWAGFIAMSFWESSAEGRNAWAKNMVGWKIRLTRNNTLTRYHFWIIVMQALFLTWPLIIYGWDIRLFGIIISAYFSGIVIEDLFWFVVNPVVKFKEMYSDFTNYYPWIKIFGKKIIPSYYVFDLTIAFFSWFYIWG